MNRKEFIQSSTLAAFGTIVAPHMLSTRHITTIKALAFDAFAIFDPEPISKAVQTLFPEQSKQIFEVWQSRQFTYQWLRALGHEYRNFWDVLLDALDFAFLKCGLDPQQAKKGQIMDAYEAIQAWPDVSPALQQIKRENLKIAFLSNMTTKMLFRGIQNSKLNEYFDDVISTDELQTYKPSPKAYQMAADKLKLSRDQILYVPFAGWDMAGAKWFGYPTFWLNRSNALPESLHAEPDGKGSSMRELLEFAGNHKR